jgi:hypothetical protein
MVTSSPTWTLSGKTRFMRMALYFTRGRTAGFAVGAAAGFALDASALGTFAVFLVVDWAVAAGIGRSPTARATDSKGVRLMRSGV